jgi:hypothetical protein
MSPRRRTEVRHSADYGDLMSGVAQRWSPRADFSDLGNRSSHGPHGGWRLDGAFALLDKVYEECAPWLIWMDFKELKFIPAATSD